MARLNKDDFMSKYKERLDTIDDVEFIEDISDSIDYQESEELTTLRAELEKARNDYEDIRTRYKERFLEATDDKVPEVIEGELEEKNIIDIREI